MTYWIDYHGHVWAWGSLTYNSKGGKGKTRKKIKDHNRQGLIVYYGNARGLPDAEKVTIVE